MTRSRKVIGVVVAWIVGARGRFRAMPVPVAAAAVCVVLWPAVTRDGQMGLFN